MTAGVAPGTPGAPDDGPAPSERGVAVVTGASTGIGRAFAEVLVDLGHDLVIAADEPAIHDVADELAGGGRRVIGLHVDLSGAPGVEHLHEVASAQAAPVTVGVLNAGMGVRGHSDEVDLDTQLRLIDLNVRSTVHLATLLARDMVVREEGRLLLVSPIAHTGPGHAAYAASQAFVHSFAEATRQELRGTGVGVTALLRGPTDTTASAGPGDDAREVARQGVAALLAGTDQTVAGAVRNTRQHDIHQHETQHDDPRSDA